MSSKNQENARAGCGYMFDEVWPSFVHTVPALEKFKGGDEPNQTGWNIYEGTEKTAWEYYSDNLEMAKRFAGAMSCFTNGHGLSPLVLIKGYPWTSIGNGTGTIVDVGCSKGTVMAEIAKSAPGLKFIIQDLPDMIQGAKEEIPSDIAGRMEFMVHDFFKEQRVRADAYFFRYIFHNWSDRNSVRILRALVPALKPGARVIINDYILPEPGTSSYIRERAIRDMDMIMLSLYNSREREKDDWDMLFREADPRFRNVKTWVPEGAMLGVVEATWVP
ncbi:hypothetical protein Plec18167_006139 [Paecilomyces lecythidis]|uniref:O-methyltransferase C-terminal domain-containing protein n=1 Tax=Paecilomyces lecythidis TaxID=3004212 RepID=A0ABR3XE17_9EURO